MFGNKEESSFHPCFFPLFLLLVEEEVIPPFIVPDTVLGAVESGEQDRQCFAGMVFNLGGLEVKKATP